jgi:hypothetical protein
MHHSCCVQPCIKYGHAKRTLLAMPRRTAVRSLYEYEYRTVLPRCTYCSRHNRHSMQYNYIRPYAVGHESVACSQHRDLLGTGCVCV